MESAPERICLLRLSALGDCINIVPVIHSLQTRWPDAAITWVLGAGAHALVGDLPGVEFVTYDKSSGRAGRRALRKLLENHQFDTLCFMHAGMRANLVSRCVPAKRRIGFNRERSRDLHGLFINERIDPPAGRHVLDGFFGFAEKLGASERKLDWSLPVSLEDRGYVDELLETISAPILAINACSSNANRDWMPDRYAAVADYAKKQLGMEVILLGSPETSHRDMAARIQRYMKTRAVDLVGRTSLKQMYELLRRVDVLVVPDSGPAHFANAGKAAVIGLYACSEPARSGPFNSLQWCVDKFDEAARKLKGKSALELSWGAKFEKPGVMEMICIDDVLQKLQAWYDQSGYATSTRPAGIGS